VQRAVMEMNCSDDLFNKYKPLIAKTANLVSKKINANYDDVYQEASIGFLYAVKHFKSDPSLSDKDNEYRFRAYIKKCIEGYALNTDTDTTIHLPVKIKKLKAIYLKNKSLNENLTLQQFAKQHHLSQKILENLQIALDLKIIYFRQEITDECEKRDSLDTIKDENQPNPEDIYITKIQMEEQMEEIYPILSLMHPLQQQILIYTYGLFDFPILSNDEIAEELNITYNHVTQNRHRALNCISRYLKTNIIKIT
jgi:RNA polymerase sigma factor (sigma-70 family)